jgi:general secretion pathway protein A
MSSLTFVRLKQMYRKFYGLTRCPFDLSPDPYFFYPTSRHNEALANLGYGVQLRKGFVVVTGEVGTGKTLLVRCLLDALASKKIAFAFVFNPRLSVSDFLAYVLSDLGSPLVGRTKSELLARLNSYLLARFQRGTTTALIVDEAHLLSEELLEEIRLLSNLETSQQKLLQIVLVGQPELDQKLDSPELRQLKQRISLRCNLGPLKAHELRGYIHRRLELAGEGSHSAEIFPDEAISLIHEFSRGIPRLVNTICENALILGYGKQLQRITPEIIRQVAANFRLDSIELTFVTKSENLEAAEMESKALSRTIEKIDRITDMGVNDRQLRLGAKAK